MYARIDTLPHTFDAGICTICRETEDWVIGTARYGKHGVYTPRHAGKAESMPVAVMRDWARAVKRRPLYGKRGVPAAHSLALTLRVRNAQHKAA